MPVKRMMMALALLVAFPTQAEEAPGMELLEYLGSWETANGKYIDPMELEADDLKAEKEDSQEQ